MIYENSIVIFTSESCFQDIYEKNFNQIATKYNEMKVISQ